MSPLRTTQEWRRQHYVTFKDVDVTTTYHSIMKTTPLRTTQEWRRHHYVPLKDGEVTPAGEMLRYLGLCSALAAFSHGLLCHVTSVLRSDLVFHV